MANQDPSLIARLKEMREQGDEQTIPDTLRVVRVKTLETKDLLLEGNFPDILTPLVVKSIYQDLTTPQIKEFFEMNTKDVEQAKKMLEAVEFVCRKSIVGDDVINDLTMSEKRWIFRLAMGPAEMLVSFRYEPDEDVESMAEGEELQPVA